MFFRQRKKGGSFSAKKLLLIQGFDQFQRFLTQNTCGFSIAAFDHAAIHILSETPRVRRQQGPNGGSESMSWNFHKSNLLQMIFKLFLGWVSYTSFVLVHQIKKKNIFLNEKNNEKSLLRLGSNGTCFERHGVQDGHMVTAAIKHRRLLRNALVQIPPFKGGENHGNPLCSFKVVVEKWR